MKKLQFLILAMLFLGMHSEPLFAQTKPVKKIVTYFLKGRVKDEDGKPILGASVFIEELQKRAATDSTGEYAFSLPQGYHTLEVSCVGYYSKKSRVDFQTHMRENFDLVKEVRELQEVEITDQSKDKNVESTQQGTSRLTIAVIRKLPTLLGEVDVIRSLQTLPGVTTVGEGANGFNVRGGNADQNLILMDDIPIFNPSHLMGFFSVFNPDAVRDMTLYRGGTPATYGGRTSSVLDIKLKEPNWDSLRLQGGFGILASRMLVETPIVKDKLALFVAARASYTNLLFSNLGIAALKKTKADFYDLTTKLRWQLNDRNSLHITAYGSNDDFKVAGDSLVALEVNATSTIFKWQAMAGSLRWNHVGKGNFIFNTSVMGSLYAPTMEIPDTAYGSRLVSEMGHYQLKSDILWLKNKNHTWRFGATGIYYILNPGDFQTTTPESLLTPRTLPKEYGTEIAVYWQDEWQINKKLSLTYGLRYASFALLGPSRVLEYEKGIPFDPSTVVGQVDYPSGEVIKFYHGAEPRFAMKMSVGTEGSIKLGYQRMQQFIHLISNAYSALPTARWKMSDPYTKPQIADQVSLGYFQNFKENIYEASVEFYLKNTGNSPDYRSGQNLLLLDGVETALLQGRGRSYGAEVFLRKKTGRTTGWLTYTYSRSKLLINSPYPEDKPFTGRWYPTVFDKPHIFNVVATYYANRHASFTANFTYSTGRATTLAEDKYYINNLYIPNFTNRNLDRIPDYHRLDLSLNLDFNPNQKGRMESSWNVSFYNVYGRRNAYSLFFRTKNYATTVESLNPAWTYRLAVIGAIVPSLTWNVKW